MGMTQLQQDALSYLTEDPGQHRERMTALHDLTEEGFFLQEEPEDETMLSEYIRENVNDFCKDGIQRFLDAVGLPNPAPIVLATMVVTVQLDDSWDEKNLHDDDIMGLVEETLFDESAGIIAARVSHVPLFPAGPASQSGSATRPIHFDVLTTTERDTDQYIADRQRLLPNLSVKTTSLGTPASFTKSSEK